MEAPLGEESGKGVGGSGVSAPRLRLHEKIPPRGRDFSLTLERVELSVQMERVNFVLHVRDAVGKARLKRREVFLVSLETTRHRNRNIVAGHVKEVFKAFEVCMV